MRALLSILVLLSAAPTAPAALVADAKRPPARESFVAHLKKLGKRTWERRLNELSHLKQLVENVSKKPSLYRDCFPLQPLAEADCRDYRHHKTEKDGVHMMMTVYMNAFAILESMKNIMKRPDKASQCKIYANQYMALVLPGVVLEAQRLPFSEHAVVKRINHSEFTLVRRGETIMELVPLHNSLEVFSLIKKHDVLTLAYHVKPKELVPPDAVLAKCMLLPQKCSCGQFKYPIFDRELFDYDLHDLQRIHKLNGGDINNFCKDSNAHFAEMIAEINRIANNNPARQKRIFDDFFPDSYTAKVFFPAQSTIVQWDLEFGRIHEANHMAYSILTKVATDAVFKSIKVLDSPAILLDSVAETSVMYSEHRPIGTVLMLNSGCLPTTAFDRYRSDLKFMSSPMVFHWLAILLGPKLSITKAKKLLLKHTNAKCQRVVLSDSDVVLAVNLQLVKRAHVLLLSGQGSPTNAHHDGLVVLEGTGLYLFHF